MVKLSLSTDPEEMKLFIALQRLGSEPITELMVMELIKQKIDSAILDATILAEAIKAANSDPKTITTPRRIAKGKIPEPGHAGKLLLLAKALVLEGKKESSSAASNSSATDNSLDTNPGMYELHLFDNIEPQRIIGRIYPPKPGVPGYNAYGKKIPAIDEKPLEIKIDDTIKREPPADKNSFETLRAQVAGYLEKQGQSLCIKEELVIKGDIDFHTGNIDFINQIKVTGHVGSGFRVRAKKGVTISGDVQAGSTINGGDGTITIGGYLVGSRLESKGNITVSNIQEADIETEAWVMISKQSAESVIRAAGGIIADKAHIFGGTIHCVEGCTAGILGNHVELATDIHLTTRSAVTSTFSSLLKQVASHEEASALLKAHLGPYAQNPKRIELLQQPHRSKMKALLAKLLQVDESLLNLVNEIKKYQEEPLAENARVTWTKKAFAGVTVYSGDDSLTLQEEVSKSKTIKRVEQKLAIVDSDALQAPDLPKAPEKQNGKK